MSSMRSLWVRATLSRTEEEGARERCCIVLRQHNEKRFNASVLVVTGKNAGLIIELNRGVRMVSIQQETANG